MKTFAVILAWLLLTAAAAPENRQHRLDVPIAHLVAVEGDDA